MTLDILENQTRNNKPEVNLRSRFLAQMLMGPAPYESLNVFEQLQIHDVKDKPESNLEGPIIETWTLDPQMADQQKVDLMTQEAEVETETMDSSPVDSKLPPSDVCTKVVMTYDEFCHQNMGNNNINNDDDNQQEQSEDENDSLTFILPDQNYDFFIPLSPSQLNLCDIHPF